MEIKEYLTYSMLKKHNKVISHKEKLNRYKTFEFIIFLVLLFCLIMYFIKFTFTIVSISLISFFAYTLLHAEYKKTEKKYDTLRADIIDTMDNSFCYHTDSMCDCRKKYIEEMEKLDIDLAIK